MKNIYRILVAVLLTACMFLPQQANAQAPDKMSYQAVVRNSSDQMVTAQGIGMQISILQTDANGTAVYVETHSATTNANGLVSIEIGNGTIVSGNFTTIDWANSIYFIKTETDPTTSGGTNYTITGPSQLLTVPYALYAKEAGTADYNALINLPTLFNGNWSSLTGSVPKISRFSNDAGYISTYTETQTLSDVINNGNSAGNANITNLADPVDAKDAANKDYVDALEPQFIIMQNILVNADILPKDYDGNTYPIVTIGTQVWMAADLKVTHYPNGNPIPNVTDYTAWGNLVPNNTDDAYCFYDRNADGIHDNTDYGYLYTYAAAIGDDWARDNTSGQGICPDGWHLPTNAEWTILIDYLGGENIAGIKMKESGSFHWSQNSRWVTNESGFTTLPGGSRRNIDMVGYFRGLGTISNHWSATEHNSTKVWKRRHNYSQYAVTSGTSSKNYGLSVRCLRD